MARYILVIAAAVGLQLSSAQAETESGYSCGPFLLQPGPEGMVVVIDHESPVEATLTYQRADGTGQELSLRHDTAQRHHIFDLEGLQPDTRYRYRVGGDGHDSGGREFRTLPVAPSAYRFIAVGDVRSRPEVWRRVSTQIHEQERSALFIVGTGDYPADGRQYSQWVGQFFDPARDLLAGMPIWPAIGNHERTRQYVSDPPPDEVEESHYFSLFELPGNEHWYRVDYQYLTLLIIDSNSPMDPGHEQYEWLREQLRSSRGRFTVAAFHHRPITSGPHGRLQSDGTPREWPLDQGRRFLMPLFELYGVDLVLNGHDHIYERSQKDGIYYVITGGGGAPLYQINSAENRYQQVAYSVHHYVTVDVTPAGMTLTAIGEDGGRLDRFDIPVSEVTTRRLTQTWRDLLLNGLAFVETADGARCEVHNPLGFEVEVSLSGEGGSVTRSLSPGETSELRVGVQVADSVLAAPAWRGSVAASMEVTLRADGDGIPLDVQVEHEILVREASFQVPRMDSPSVDGRLDDWPDGAVMMIDSGSRTILRDQQYGGDGDLRVTVRTGWSADGLHLAFAVDDDDLVVSPGVAVWQNDGVELYFDGRPEAARPQEYGPGVAQLILSAQPTGDEVEGNRAWKAEEFRWAVHAREGGYDLEVTLPFDRIREAPWAPAAGDSLRFDAMINDRDEEEGGQSHHRLWSTGGASSNTSGYGLLVLAD